MTTFSFCTGIRGNIRRKKIRKRKADKGFHNPIGAFRRKADYRNERNDKRRCEYNIPWLSLIHISEPTRH